MQFSTFKFNVQICIKMKGKIGETVTPKDSLTFANFSTKLCSATLLYLSSEVFPSYL